MKDGGVKHEATDNMILEPKVARILEACGIELSGVSPLPIGTGGNHLVYRSTDFEWVVKIPINQHIGTVANVDEERRNLESYLEYFGDYAVPAQVMESNVGYCTVMRYIAGRVITANDISQFYWLEGRNLTYVGRQLEEVVEYNNRLVAEQKRFLDLVGLYGLPYSLAGLCTGGSASRLTNVLVDDCGKLHIIDYDMLDLCPRTPFDKVKSIFAYQLNRQTLGRYYNLSFGVGGEL